MSGEKIMENSGSVIKCSTAVILIALFGAITGLGNGVIGGSLVKAIDSGDNDRPGLGDIAAASPAGGAILFATAALIAVLLMNCSSKIASKINHLTNLMLNLLRASSYFALSGSAGLVGSAIIGGDGEDVAYTGLCTLAGATITVLPLFLVLTFYNCLCKSQSILSSYQGIDFYNDPDSEEPTEEQLANLHARL